MKNNQNLIWIDLEMTGLDPQIHKIIEIATIVTDKDLNIIAKGPVIAINQPQSELDLMDSWCKTTHGNNGLTDRVKISNINEASAEQQTISFLNQYIDAGISPICGNSVGQDKRFLLKYMPNLANFFHYRMIDVSTIKELVNRWYDTDKIYFEKQSSHLALNDIEDSINELKFYRSNIFK